MNVEMVLPCSTFRPAQQRTYGLADGPESPAKRQWPYTMSLGDLPYDLAAGLRRYAAAAGDLQLTAILDRDQVAVDANSPNRQGIPA